MLSLVELASYLTRELNAIGSAEGYEFNIYAEIGENKPKVINGVLRTDYPQTTPVANVTNVKYDTRVEFAVPYGVANFNLKNIESIVNRFIKNANAKEVEFSDGKGLITATLTTVRDFKTEAQTGTMLPLEFIVRVNYTENVVTGGAKHWFLNGYEIPFLNESIIVEKNGISNPINGENYKKTLLTDQIKLYRFRFPYETSSELCSMLQKDLLEGSANKKYDLSFYDGISFTENNAFTTKVSVFRTGDTGSQMPETSMFDITFTDVDDESLEGTVYEMALVDFPFDEQSENTPYFANEAEQIQYFDGLILEGADYVKIEAPNLNSIDLTNQIYRNTNNYDLFDLVNKNYAIIRVHKGENYYYFYYWVRSSNIGAENQVSYDMHIDSIQTYYIRDEIDIQGSFIQKAHLDRWTYNSDGTTVTFNGKADSKLFEREEIKEVAKRLVSRSKLEMYSNYGTNNKVCDWLNNYVYAWVYVVIDANQEYKIKNNDKFKINPTTFYRSDYSADNYSYSTACVCFPLYKYIQASIRFKGNFNGGWDINSLTQFVNNNGGYSYVKSVKISIKPPFDLNGDHLEYKIETEDVLGVPINYLTLTTVSTSIDGVYGLFNSNINDTVFCSGLDWGLLVYDKDYTNPIKLKTNITLPDNTFDKLSVINSNKNKVFNPKLNSNDYKTLVLSFAGSTYEMDLQKINKSQTIEFDYIEMITADVTKGICRYKSTSNDDVFSIDYSKSFNGLIFTNDLSLPISNGQLDLYLANNKNAYLSYQNQQTLAATQYGIRSANSISNILKNPANLVNETQQILTDTISSTVKAAYNDAQFNLSIDNMRNAPQTLINANGNVSFISAVAEFGIYAELYEGLDTELEMANDIMFRDGYTLNRFDNLKTKNGMQGVDHIRKRFNYVKAIIGSIGGIAMSNSARADLRQRFANGVRFWNAPYNIDYMLENYELKLDE
jgi:hypothetical protein